MEAETERQAELQFRNATVKTLQYWYQQTLALRKENRELRAEVTRRIAAKRAAIAVIHQLRSKGQE